MLERTPPSLRYTAKLDPGAGAYASQLRQPIRVGWGPDLIHLCNDACRSLVEEGRDERADGLAA